jgi:ABC-type spermidine/putrescine transport system permease subunit I
MKKKLWKPTVISFLMVFILFFWLGDRTRLTTDINGLSSHEYLTNSEYFLKTFGYSLAVTAIILLGAYLISFSQKKKREILS